MRKIAIHEANIGDLWETYEAAKVGKDGLWWRSTHGLTKAGLQRSDDDVNRRNIDRQKSTHP
jgi:hypothetical protein